MRPYLFVLSLLLAAVLLVNLALAGCERGIHLRVENRLDTDVILSYTTIDKNGSPSVPVLLGGIPRGQEGQSRTVIVLGQESEVAVVNLIAQDSSNTLVWQNAWSYQDFLKLSQSGWKVLLSQDTGIFTPYY